MRAIALAALAGALIATGAFAARSVDTTGSALSEIELFNVCDTATTMALKAERPLEAGERNAANSVYMTYGSDTDATETTVQCQVSGDQVVWHVVEAEGPAGLLPQVAEARGAEVYSFRLTDAGVEISAAS